MFDIDFTMYFKTNIVIKHEFPRQRDLEYFKEKVDVGETERVSSPCVNEKMKRAVMIGFSAIANLAVMGPEILCDFHPI